MARAGYTAITKDSNTQQPQQTGAGTHDKHLPSPTTKFPKNAPPAPHQKKKRAPETPKRRSNIDQGLERSLARANCAAIAKDRNINTQQPRQTGALAHSTSIFHLQRPNFIKRAKRKTDRKRRRGQRRRRVLGQPARAPARTVAARAARARAAAAADDRADAREGRRERRVGDWHGARVAAAAPPPTGSLGDDEDNDDEGRPVNAHDEHVPLCVRRRPRRLCSRRRR